MMPRVIHSSDRVFITAAGPRRWRRMGSPGSWCLASFGSASTGGKA